MRRSLYKYVTCKLFIDNIRVKGPYSTYGNKEVCLGVRQYVIEYIQALDRTLKRLERAGTTIGPKSQFCISSIKIVGYICRAEGRSLDSTKIIKILKWKPCKLIEEARAFIGVYIYY